MFILFNLAIANFYTGLMFCFVLNWFYTNDLSVILGTPRAFAVCRSRGLLMRLWDAPRGTWDKDLCELQISKGFVHWVGR